MMPYRRNSPAEQRFTERRRREDEAPKLLAEVPTLSSLQIEVEERSGVGHTKYLRRVLVDRAPAMFLVPCCDPRCTDGEHDLTELALLAGINENLVADALQELHEKELLDAEPTLTQSGTSGISRREAIGRAARYGAAAAAGSMIVSATAATPAMASSEEAIKCCQCYKQLNCVEICACTTDGLYTANNAVCNEYCRSENGKPGPVCSKNGSGLIIGTKCEGPNNECK